MKKYFSERVIKFIFYISVILAIFFLFVFGMLSIKGSALIPQDTTTGISLVSSSYILLFLILLPLINY